MARRLAIALTVLLTVLISVTYVASGSVPLRTGLGQATIAGLPVALLLVAWRAPRPVRGPLALTVVAGVLYVAAEVTATSLSVGGVTPHPNPGEAFIVVGGVVDLVAFRWLLGRRLDLTGASRLDVGIVAVAVVLLFAQTGVLSSAGSGGAPVAVAGSLVLVAVAHLAIGVLLIGRSGGARASTSMLVAAMSLVLADVAFLMATVDGSDEDGRLTDVGYVVARGALVVMVLLLGQPATDGYRAVERYRVGVAGAVALLTPLGAVIGARTNPDAPDRLSVVAVVLPVLLCTHGPGFVLVVCDLDGFKVVNDRYGHTAGDKVLLAVADLLRRSAPSGATVARLGGDEFAVLVPQAGAPDAVRAALAERLEPGLAGPEGPAEGLGASLGAAAGGSGSDAVELLALADSAMYAAKQARRTSGPGDRAPGHPPPGAPGPEAGRT